MFLQNIAFALNFMIMNDELNLKEILEWYLGAGVDETCSDVPFGLEKPEEKIVAQKLAVARSSVAPLRQATTELAQTTINACQSAKEICEKVTTLEELKVAIEAFEGCALKLTASHTVFGDGNPDAKIVFVGEAPGADEDRMGLPFVGRSGHLLDKILKAAGLERSECYICNILPWRPPGNRTPLDSEIAVCLPFLKKQIDLINPDIIFTLGGSAANALLDIAESISKLRGKWMEYKKSNGEKAQVLASFHPAYLLRNPGQKAKVWADVLRMKKNIQ